MRKKFAPLEERDANSAASQPAFGRYSRSEFPNSEISFLIKEKPITGTPIDPERIVRSEIAWKFFAPQLPDHIVFSPEPTTQPIEKPLIAVELIPGYVNHPPPHERYEIGEDGKAKHCVSGEPDETLQLSKSELDELIAIVKNNESRGDVSTTVDMPCYVLSDRVVTVEYLSTAADTDAGVEKSAPFKVLEFMRKKFAETEE
ncbi:MAG TPA: hypothetical protein PK402_01980 [Tepidisphaeraceae bacterium]|nr:hypothetical protein [Tepidisphaeraceae bacterium]